MIKLAQRPGQGWTPPGTSRSRATVASATLARATLALAAAGLVGCSSSGSPETFCAQIRRVPVITEADDLTVPDTATATKALLTELRRLHRAAPDRVRGDVAVLVAVVQDIAVALAEDDEAATEAAKQRVAKSSDAWKAASDNVVSYASATCGLDLGAR